MAICQLLAGSTLVSPYDEALTLYGASRVARGDLPYRDFWTLYGPGSFFVLAGLDRLFGESVLVGRAFDAASRSAIVLLVFALVPRRGASWVPWVATGVAAMVLAGVREYVFPALPATALAMLSMLALRRALADSVVSSFERDARGWLLPGLAVGATVLFRHDFGIFALLACLWAWWRAGRAAGRDGPAPGRALGFLLAGAVLVAAPPFLALLTRVPAADMVENLIRLPLRVYAEQRSLPFPLPAVAWREALAQRSPGPLLGLAGVWVPPLAMLAAAAWTFRRSWRSRSAGVRFEPSGVLFEALVLLGLCLCAKGAVRVQVLHMVPAMVVAIVVIAQRVAATTTRAAENAARPGPRRLAAAVMALVVLATAVMLVQRARTWRADQPVRPLLLKLGDWRACIDRQTAPLGCFVVRPDHAAVLAVLREWARPGDTMYVGAGRHDKIFVNDVDLYFLSGLPAATRWHDLHPGVQTTRETQREMMDEMTRRPPAFVVLDTAWDDWDEPNGSRLSSGVTLLDAYLRANFRPVFTAGTLTISVPRRAAAP